MSSVIHASGYVRARQADAAELEQLREAFSVRARYRMDIEYRHHEMSGSGGEVVVVPRLDPAGEWVRVPAE